MKVSMIPDNSVKMIHASQDDVNRRWEFELYDEDGLIDVSSVSEQMVFPVYSGGTEQILPENTSTPTTSPIIADIVYPDEEKDDQEFLYRECPTTEDGNAKIKTIYGQTLKWNQLWDVVFPTRTTNGITFTNNGDGSFTLNGTATNTADFRFTTTDGTNNLYNYPTAKYLFKCDNINSNVQIIIMSYPDFTRMVTFTTTEMYGNITGRDNCFAMVRVNSGVTLNNVRYRPQFFNLSQTFGSGNEPTAQEFEALFPLPYYAFNSGTLLPFMGESIKTTGKNLVSDSMWEQGAINAGTGEISVNTATNRLRTNQFIRVLPNVQYSFSMESTRQIFIYRYNLDGSYISYYPNEWSNPLAYTPTQDEMIKIVMRKSDNADIDPSFIIGADFQMEIGSASSYEPYTSSTIILPTLTYFPTGMKSVGSVYDEITESKAITRVGSVDLGSLTWTKGGTAFNTLSLASLIKLPPNNSTKPNIIGVNMIPVSSNDDSGVAGTYEVIVNRSTGQLSYRYPMTGIADGDAFATLMSGTYMYFELAEPVETPIASASLVSQNQEIPMVVEDDKLVAYSTQEITEKSGFHDTKIKLSNDGVAYSAKFTLHVERKP